MPLSIQFLTSDNELYLYKNEKLRRYKDHLDFQQVTFGKQCIIMLLKNGKVWGEGRNKARHFMDSAQEVSKKVLRGLTIIQLILRVWKCRFMKRKIKSFRFQHSFKSLQPLLSKAEYLPWVINWLKLSKLIHKESLASLKYQYLRKRNPILALRKTNQKK